MDNLKQFAGQSYLNLETFRKTGEGVKTPVWFAEDQGTLYVRTVDNSAKIKRLRRNGSVRVAPCDVGGSLKGEWVTAEARLVEDAAAAGHVNGLMNRKYGFMKRLFDARLAFSKTKMVAVAITLKG